MLQAFDNEELKEDYRATLKAFYGVEKSMGAYIQFAFFTGVTKFSKVSVFSDLNKLADISMDNATLKSVVSPKRKSTKISMQK